MSLADLFERDGELARIDAAVTDAAGGRGRLVIVEGEAGIGKTALLRAAAERAHGRNVAVLRARGGELERDLAYGIARQLLERRLLDTSAARRRTVLAGAAAAAAPALGLARGELELSPEDAGFAIQHGLYWVVANLATHVPLLLVVDDAHWADDPSLRWLTYLAHRVEDLPIAVLAAVRSGDPAADAPLVRALRAARTDALVEPQPLSAVAARRLVGSQLAHVADRCHRASGGNPFLLQQLAQSLAEQEPGAMAGAVEQMSTARVAEHVRQRLARLPPAAARLADAIAVLGADAEPRHARDLARLDGDEADAARDALTAARMLSPGLPLSFVHPILRSTLYAHVPRAGRSAAHRRAAALLHADDPRADRAAMHLLSADPAGDPWSVECLCDAGRRALARGAPESALTFVERALAEPPSSATRAAVLLLAGQAAAELDAGRALAHLRPALAEADDAETRVTAARALAGQLVGSEEAVDVLEATLEGLRDSERELRLGVEADLAALGQFSHAHSARIGRRLERLSDDLAGKTPAERVLLAALACDRLLRCAAPAAHVGDLAERALAADDLPFSQQGLAIECLLYAERFDVAEQTIDRILADARERVSRSLMAGAHAFRGRLHLLCGDLRTSCDESANALAHTEALPPGISAFVASGLVRAMVARSPAAAGAAEQLLAEHDVADGPLPPTTLATDVLLARCELRTAAGRAPEAVEDGLEALRRRSLSGGRLPPAGWRTTVALALHAAGDRDQAERLVDEEVAIAEDWGAPGALGSALRVQGLLQGGDEGCATLARAIEVLERSDRRLELARALVDHGAALRRGRRRVDSREPLRRGLDLAHHCDATALAERAHEELLAGGARPRRPALSGRDALTPSEQRVAALAAEGLDNPAIAQALFVSRRTVETHLGSVYRKLGISSRHELADVTRAAPAAR